MASASVRALAGTQVRSDQIDGSPQFSRRSILREGTGLLVMTLGAKEAQAKPPGSRAWQSTMLQRRKVLEIEGKLPAAGFRVARDTEDNYQFYYPNGWEQVSVQGYEAVYTDVIEILDSVSLAIADTSRKNVRDLGSPEEACRALVDKQLATETQTARLLKASEKVDSNGIPYYDFEFALARPDALLHGLGVLTIADGAALFLVWCFLLNSSRGIGTVVMLIVALGRWVWGNRREAIHLVRRSKRKPFQEAKSVQPAEDGSRFVQPHYGLKRPSLCLFPRPSRSLASEMKEVEPLYAVLYPLAPSK